MNKAEPIITTKQNEIFKHDNTNNTLRHDQIKRGKHFTQAINFYGMRH